MLTGYKTYIAAAALMLTGGSYILAAGACVLSGDPAQAPCSTGFDKGIALFFEGLGLLGLRAAFSRATGK